MRFTRFAGRGRDDKALEDATTADELADLYRTARRAPTSLPGGADRENHGPFGKIDLG